MPIDKIPHPGEYCGHIKPENVTFCFCLQMFLPFGQLLVVDLIRILATQLVLF